LTTTALTSTTLSTSSSTHTDTATSTTVTKTVTTKSDTATTTMSTSLEQTTVTISSTTTQTFSECSFGRYGSVWEGRRRLHSQLRRILEVATAAACAVHCDELERCVSFSFRLLSQDCRLHATDSIGDSQWRFAGAWDSYVFSNECVPSTSTISATSTTVLEPKEPSCVGFCYQWGISFVRPSGESCFCDVLCQMDGICCSDFGYACLGESTEATNAPITLVKTTTTKTTTLVDVTTAAATTDTVATTAETAVWQCQETPRGSCLDMPCCDGMLCGTGEDSRLVMNLSSFFFVFFLFFLFVWHVPCPWCFMISGRL
jgi:hypothetical protein